MQRVLRGALYLFWMTFCALFAASAAQAATYTVSGTGDSAAGSCAGTSCPDLRAAVVAADADPGSTIALGDAEYRLTEGELLIDEPTMLVGEGPARSVIRQEGTYRVLKIASAAVTIEGIAISGGFAYGPNDLAESDGQAGEGGGILATGGLTLIDDAILEDGAFGGVGGTASGTGNAGDGGFALGGGVRNTGPLTIVDTTFAKNVTESGGGGIASGTGNGGSSHNSDGGAIFENGALSIYGSTIAENETIAGFAGVSIGGGAAGSAGVAAGAVNSQGGPLSIVNTTIAGNVARTQLGPAAIAGLIPVIEPFDLTLASDTLAENVAEGAQPSSADTANMRLGTGSLEVADTVFQAGSGAGENCTLIGTNVVASHNDLESDAGAACGLSSVGGNLIGVDPELEPLAENGGPTRTMALRPGSPALGAGGECLNIAESGSPALIADQRGEARSDPCDIGAWEAQLPTPAAAPAIGGQATVGGTLTCETGAWHGEQPLSFEIGWLANKQRIAGAGGATYRPTSAEAGSQLSCEVTASNAYGSGSATSAAVSVVQPSAAPLAPRISHVRQSHRIWREGGTDAGKRLPVGTTFSFRLDQPATVTYRFRSIGRRRSYFLTRAGQAGINDLHFAGRLSSKNGPHKMLPGSYNVRISAESSACLKSNTVTLKFEIAGGRG